MRIKSLGLQAFGPFTGLQMDFPGDGSDLHVVHGPNEAGKSSLLRAIGDLLFGIPAQSPDNFLHAYPQLLLEATLERRDGAELHFRRRKGNRNTLLDQHGGALPDSVLAPFLGPVDRGFFSVMFGLGAAELRDGARQLLEGGGNLGNALFSASMGGTPVEKVLEALDEEAGKLFRGNARKNVTIRPAIQLHAELAQQSRAAAVPPERWDLLARELEQAMATRGGLEEEIARLDGELAWLGRCEDSLPAVSSLGEAMDSLGRLEGLPDTGPDFVQEAREALAAARESGAESRRLQDQIRALGEELVQVRAMPAVLARAGELELLHQGLGAHRDRLESLGRAGGTLAGLEPVLRAGMASLGLAGEIGGLGSLRLTLPERLACEETAQAVQAAEDALKSSQKETRDKANRLEALQARLAGLPETDLSSIREALEAAAVATGPAAGLSAARGKVARLRRDAEDNHGLLRGAPADLPAASGLPVPQAAAIRRHQVKAEEIERLLEASRRKVDAAEERRASTAAELARLERRGELPTDESLREARERRDRGWSLVLAEWKGPGAVGEPMPGKPLEEAYPELVAEADGIADRLRLEAEAVAQAEERRAQLSDLAAQADAAQLELEAQKAAAAECQAAWVAEWQPCGIHPRSHAEMAEWRDLWVAFRGSLTKAREAQEALVASEAVVNEACTQLAAALGDSPAKGFSTLYASALAVVREGESAAGSRAEVSGQVRDLTRELAALGAEAVELSQAAAAAREAWRARAGASGLPPEVSPAAGLALLRERGELLARFDGWLEASGLAANLARRNHEYEEAVEESANALGLRQEGADTLALEALLWAALTEARTAATRQQQVTERLGQARDGLQDAQFRATEAESRLAELAARAGVGAAADLEPLLGRLGEREDLRRRVRELRMALANLARTQTIDEFVGKVRAEDPESLPARRALAEGARAGKMAELEAVNDRLRDLGAQKAALERAGDEAADYLQRAATCAATLRRDASRFVRMRLASRLLREHIDSFRRLNQGPMLARSGEFFQRLTGGSFSGLRAGFGEGDAPVLVGVRPGGVEVGVDGMSEGTRDQLFLSLRLAALEQHVADHEPMPLILDDLLVTFDDARARAILAELRDLSEKAQVLLFTHHDHVVGLCRETLGPGGFHLHRLCRNAAPG